MKRVLLLVLPVILFTGCLEKKERAFFADDGITLGETKRVAGGDLFIPIQFETRVMHSAQWLYDVEWTRQERDITITAVYNVPPGEKKSVYADGITVKRDGSHLYDAYRIQYRDPDGKMHDVGEVRTVSQAGVIEPVRE